MTDVSRNSSRIPRRWPRLLALALLSLALHLLLVDWGKRHLLGTAAQDEPVLTVELRPLPPPRQPVSLPVAKPAAPKKTAAAPARKAPPPTPIEPPDEPIRETVETIAPQPAVTAAAEAGAASGNGNGKAEASPGQGDDTGPAQAQAPTAAGEHYDTNPPPSARLGYDAQSTRDGLPNPYRGTTTLDWKNDGRNYHLEVITKALWITWANFSSRGAIDAFGVSPELYTEQTGRRAATNTHFQRERKLISFSASTETYPRRGGEQDRASVLLQLAAIGRGDATRFQPGSVIDLFVAGARDGEVWRIQVLGEEQIRLPIGELRAWHVARMPTPGTYDKRIDIWLAPQHEWYPARVLYTDLRRDGEVVDLKLSEIERPASTETIENNSAPAAQNR
ncbi:DUF3108 domain-containing protein [Herbaspirillum sp. WKF16]|jgi:hypothetical protein|uniref:DUF3108 domain-containing protein n=1 Tax=Herbaspirillum sp. WKF16 TaxID=3028312 RepID=UPI0023A92BB5|nr:DUF3108 domain-containing protein [Herbaspirillum sp. WKF16]WDZ95550.1 DUF3108 domain-containing protein [Herbaspirillum sp. WKF16]